MLGVAALFLLLDLGRPQLFWLLFVRPTGSLLSLGAFLLSATLLVALLLLVDVAVRPLVGSKARKATEVVLCALSLGVMVYTGLYMACMESVPLWNNPALPVLFAFSSLSSGLSCVLVLLPFMPDFFRLRRVGSSAALHSWGGACSGGDGVGGVPGAGLAGRVCTSGACGSVVAPGVGAVVLCGIRGCWPGRASDGGGGICFRAHICGHPGGASVCTWRPDASFLRGVCGVSRMLWIQCAARSLVCGSSLPASAF